MQEHAVSTEGQETGEVAEIIERPFTLRKLKDSDLFPLLKILKKLVSRTARKLSSR